ncbi:MAG TPA: caspase family protein [Lysobacter sp.]|nr:caspase family protein [Lysobacter sp.]
MDTAIARTCSCLLFMFGILIPVHLSAQALPDSRVALVIGNAAYATAPLSNSRNDARAMGVVLKELGFSVIELLDASKEQMDQAIARTRDTLKDRRGVGMLYYAGHGLQIEWHNFMVPVDAALRSGRDIPMQTVDLQQVIDAFKAAGTRMNIIVLDACRDNPFGATGRGTGLAQMDAPWGSFLAYATAPGNVAEDGAVEGGNSLYTHYLLQELKRTGARIEDVFKRVRLQVRQSTDGRQIPWESTSLEDEFYFDAKVKPEQRPDEEERARQSEEALSKEKSDWERIANSTSAKDLYDFLRKYPNGLIAELAQFRLDRIQKARVQVQPSPNGIVPLPSGTNRYAKGDVIVLERTDELAKEARRVTLTVTHADDDKVEMNGGSVVLDQMGGTLRNRFGTKSPAFVAAPAELSLGKRWRSAFTNTREDGEVSSNYWDSHVVALETIQVPAGTFRVYKVERSGWARHPGGRTIAMSGTLWIDPQTMMTVRNDLLFRSKSKVVEQSSDRLVELHRAPRPAQQ